MGSLPLTASLHSTLYMLYVYTEATVLSPLLIAILINILMLARIVMGFGMKYTLYRLMRGQILPMMLYIMWLIVFPQDEHLFALPLILSNIGKCYLLCTTPRTLDIDAVESIIILQAKFEISIIIYMVLRLLISVLTLRPTPYALLVSATLIIIMKFKYEIHYGTRRAYEEIHFGLDRISKLVNLRGGYHVLHRSVSQLGSSWNSGKQITY